jgi:hypothetical protein
MMTNITVRQRAVFLRHLLPTFLILVAATCVMAATPRPGVLLRVIEHPFPQQWPSFGWAMAPLGNVDTDTTPDLAISAPWQDDPTGRGTVYVMSGSTGTVIRQIQGVNTGSAFGWALAPMGAGADLAIGAAWDGPGSVWLAENAMTPITPFGTPSPLSDNAEYGSVIATGDIDGDGVIDLVVGAPYAMERTGQVFVISGRTQGLLYAISPPSDLGVTKFGAAIALVKGPNGAVEKLIVGAPGGGKSAGYDAFVYSPAGGEPLATLAPPDLSYFGYGASLAYLGTTDGVAYVAVGASSSFGPNQVYLFDATTGNHLLTITDPAGKAGGGFARFMAAVGDVNGDRIPDVAVSGDVSDDLGSGSVYVFSGATGEQVLNIPITARGRSLMSTADSYPLAAAGDLDHDGVQDLAVGLPWEKVGENTSQGSVQVFSLGAGATGTGTDVTVQPVDPDPTPGAGNPVTITFDTVGQTGTTTVKSAPTGTPLPQGFKLGNPPVYYEIATTAQYTGVIKVCIDFSGIKVGSGPRLLHKGPNGWEDITTSVTGSLICGTVASLSPFVIAEPYDFSGFFPPVSAAAINTVQAGRTIPIKWQLRDSGGAYISDLSAVTIQLQPVACDGFLPISDLTEIVTSESSGLHYDSDANQYVYNWKTSKSAVGSCSRLTLNLFGSSSVTPLNFKLK